MSLEDRPSVMQETPIWPNQALRQLTMLDLDQAGVGAVMRELDGLINLDQMTVNGKPTARM